MKFRSHRYRTEFPIAFRTPSGNVKAVINDVNDTGALVTVAAPLERGQKISMRFLNNQVEAIVQWSRQGKCGISFRPMLTIAQVDVLRQRSGSQQSMTRHNVMGFSEMR